MKKISAGAIAVASVAALFGVGPAPAAQAATPDAPADLHVVDMTSDHIDLAWTGVPGAVEYLIDGTPCSPINTGDTTSFRINSSLIDPSCGYFPGTYNINVRGRMGDGNTAPSNTVTVDPP